MQIRFSPRERFRLILAVLAFLTAGFAFLTAILVFVYETVRYRQYVGVPKETEQRAVEQIRKLLEERGNQASTVPFVVATADGPDLRIEAGYELLLNVSQGKAPDGSGKYGAVLTDYAIGGYRVEEAPNAQEVLAVLQDSVDGFLAPKVKGLEVVAEVIGCADGIGIKDDAFYRGDLGKVDRVPYFSYDRNQASYMTLVPGRSRLTNESIAFLRAYDFLRHLSSFRTLQEANPVMNVIGVQTTSHIGGEYRRVIFKMVAKNALENQYQELGPVVRSFVLPRQQGQR